MKTDDLIAMLAQDPARWRHTHRAALYGGGARPAGGGLVLMLVLFGCALGGAGHGAAHVLGQAGFAALAAGGWLCCAAWRGPAWAWGTALALLGPAAAGAVGLAAVALGQAGPASACPWCWQHLAQLCFQHRGAVAVRPGGQPAGVAAARRPMRLAAGGAGLLAGALGALVHALHCPRWPRLFGGGGTAAWPAHVGGRCLGPACCAGERPALRRGWASQGGYRPPRAGVDQFTHFLACNAFDAA